MYYSYVREAQPDNRQALQECLTSANVIVEHSHADNWIIETQTWGTRASMKLEYMYRRTVQTCT